MKTMCLKVCTVRGMAETGDHYTDKLGLVTVHYKRLLISHCTTPFQTVLMTGQSCVGYHSTLKCRELCLDLLYDKRRIYNMVQY